MRKRLWIVAVGTWSLVGCLNTSAVIRVAPDGSGTIEQTLMFNLKNVEKAFAGMGMKPSGKSETIQKPMDEAAMKKAAEELGNGVTLVSVTPIKEPSGFEGATVRFRFDDITKLETEEFLMPSSAKEATSNDAKSRVTFAMTKSATGTSILTATFNEGGESGGGSKAGKSGKSSKGGPPLDDPEVAQLVKALFKGFKIAMHLEVIGQIVRADADHVNGKRITLAEIDLEQLMQDSKKLDSLEKILGPDASIEAVRPYLKDVKGLKINRPVVTVEFR